MSDPKSKPGTEPETETVVFSIHIDATKEAVWAELTKTDAPQGGVDFTVTVENVRLDSRSGKSWKGSGGAAFIGKTIKEVVENGRASLSTRAIYRFFDLVGPLGTAKKIEDWPLED